MAIKFEKIKANDVLLDIHRRRMGNTTMSEWGLWNVYVVSVDTTARSAIVSWNGNRHETWSERRLTKLYTKPTKAYLAQQERRKQGGL